MSTLDSCQVKQEKAGLFNALNLATLQIGRPAVLESPAICSHFQSAEEYLLAWRAWYMEIDRSGPFWQEDAGKSAAKKNLDLPSAFAGLLLFDLLCLSAARRMFADIGATRDSPVPFARVRWAS